jgi:hypothetical protein
MRKNILWITAATLPLAGCMGDGVGRMDGVTSGAGNAIAANTVMQMVDPWQPGIEDTDLKVPADRTAAAPAADDAGGTDGGKDN